MSTAKTQASGLSAGKNSTMQSQSFSSCPVRLKIVFKLHSQDRQTPFPTFWLNTRDTQTIHRASVLLYSLLLQGITVRPVPCKSNVFQ
jgi:hypothetical protein